MADGDRILTPADRPKVFGIGLHKTSTTSLANALYTIGLDVGGYFDTGRFESEAELKEFVLREAARRDAVQDMPWPAFYRLLDDEFPGSKFVLTVRDPDRWIASVVTHFGRRQIASHEYIYGVPTAEGHESTYLAHLDRHEREVRDHFAGRPDDLLVMDIAGGDGWTELCDFLGTPPPDLPFPSQNQVAARRASRYRRVAGRSARTAASRLGLPDRVLDRGRVDADTAYGSIHALCRRFDSLFVFADRSTDSCETSRLEGMLRSWLEFQHDWVQLHSPIEGGGSVHADLAGWHLARAWSAIELATRRWGADLSDEGAGVRAADGSDASAAVRACVNTGVDHWERIVRAFDLDDPFPALDRI